MNLVGYLKPLGEYSFSFPIYKDEGGYYCHRLSEDFKILGFDRYYVVEDLLKKIPRRVSYKKHFEVGDEGVIVFISNNDFVIIDEFHKAVIAVLKELDRSERLNKYLYEEVICYSGFLSASYKHAKEDVGYYLQRLYLKKYILENVSDVYVDVLLIMDLIDDYVERYKLMRKRNALRNYYKKNNKKVLLQNEEFGIDMKMKIIDGYKERFVAELIGGRTRKAFSVLYQLLEYQIPVSPQKYIVKTFCALSKIIQLYGYVDLAKILLYLSDLFYVSDPVVSNQFAEILKSEGDYQGAKLKYRETEKDFPENVVAKNGYADVLKLEGDFEGAKSKYREIEKDFPQNVVTKCGYADVLKLEGDYEGAKSKYREIEKDFPEEVVAKNGYADVLKLEGDYEGAKSKYREIEKDFPQNVVAKCSYADVLKLEGDYEGAKSKYREIEKDFPEEVVAKSGYADVLKLEGDLEGAKAKYREIQSRFPTDLYSKHSLVVLNMITEDVVDENDFLVRANPRSLHDYYFYHAYIMYAIKGQYYEKAENMILGVINEVPFYSSKRLFEQTYLYLKLLLKRYSEAFADIGFFSYPEKGCPVSNVIKAEICFMNGLEGEAIRYLDLLKKYPENSIAYSLGILMTQKYLTKNVSSDLHGKEELDRFLADEEFKLLGLCA